MICWPTHGEDVLESYMNGKDAPSTHAYLANHNIWSAILRVCPSWDFLETCWLSTLPMMGDMIGNESESDASGIVIHKNAYGVTLLRVRPVRIATGHRTLVPMKCPKGNMQHVFVCVRTQYCGI